MFALALLLLSPAPNAQSDLVWGWEAHKMVCVIAWWEMEDDSRSEISDMLEGDDGYSRFVESCLWADDVRGRDERYDSWRTAHYVNLPRGVMSFDLERDCGETFCVVEGIIESRRVLADRTQSPSSRLDALKFLSHFIGDIHQPLHAGYADDRGGNDTRLVLFGQNTNLHAIWDYGLLSHTNREWMDYASLLYFQITDEDRRAWATEEPARWTEESFSIVVSSAYNVGDGQIGQQYYDRHIRTIERRIKQAGVRLADQLDSLLGEG